MLRRARLLAWAGGRRLAPGGRRGLSSQGKQIDPYTFGSRPTPFDEGRNFLGVKWGEYKEEGWERITFGSYAAAVAIMAYGYMTKDPEDDIRVWARKEAMVREKRMKLGLPIEYGKVYSNAPQYQYAESEIDTMPEVLDDDALAEAELGGEGEEEEEDDE